MQKIRKVCVIGSGVMGSGIAAQIANSKTDVILLDIPQDSGDTFTLADIAVTKMHTQKPSPLSHPDLSHYITTGNLRDDLHKISQCDLVIEVIVEKLEIKHDLYQSLLPHLKSGAIIASNTSTLLLKDLKQKLPPQIQKNFAIVHFFNPVRYLNLVELVSDQATNKNSIASLKQFIFTKLGKTIVECNDTPGFIANRIGCFLLELVVRKGIKANLNPALIDKMFTKLLGFPNTGIFGLYDLIGHDVMELISDSLISALPSDDKYHAIYHKVTLLEALKRSKSFGRKSGAGFYRITRVEEKRVKEVTSLDSINYQTVKIEAISHNIKELVESNNIYSHFFEEVLSIFFNYVFDLIPSVSSNPEDIDKAMQLGYSLKYGPFALFDQIYSSFANQIGDSSTVKTGLTWLDELAKKRDAIYTNDSTLQQHTESIKWYQNTEIIILNHEDARLVEYQNHHIFIIDTKMNILTVAIFELLIQAVEISEEKQKSLYIYPAGSQNFSVGANLALLHDYISGGDFNAIDQYITIGQKAMMTLKHAKINIVSCAYGVALGGGCELLLHSDLVVAHQNLKAGLVELSVGLIPGWGGVKEMFMRSEGNRGKLIQNLKNILLQNTTNSANYFLLDYNVTCDINMQKLCILEQAFNEKIIKKPKISAIKLPSLDLVKELHSHNLNDLQIDVLSFFQKIVDMGTIQEDTILALEKEKFLELAAKPECIKYLAKFSHN